MNLRRRLRSALNRRPIVAQIEFDVSICSLMPSASELFYRSLELVGRASMEWVGVFDSEWRRINGELLTRLA